jgi:hypothetical protein
MDFCDCDAPWGEVRKVQSVLDFLVWAACIKPDGQTGIDDDSLSGLAFILLACRESLRKAGEASERE